MDYFYDKSHVFARLRNIVYLTNSLNFLIKKLALNAW